MIRKIKDVKSMFPRILAFILLAVLIYSMPVGIYAKGNGIKDITLCPGGMPFGVRFYTRGVLIVGVTEVVCSNGKESPALDAGLHAKDVITEINGKEVNTVDEVSESIGESSGQTLELKVKRSNKEIKISLTPVASEPDGIYRAGLWIRDSTAGIGTVTFINPKNNTFAGLGHGICDVDTGELMPLLRGTVSNVTINGVTKGIKGIPGELKGYFSTEICGSLLGNTLTGVYGQMDNITSDSLPKSMSLASGDEVHEGEAYILCTVGSEQADEYKVEIVKIDKNNSDCKNFVIKIVDPALLEKTGGIVQGMSGSPVIQDGKLCGAVTHVLVNDPTSGYGIFIENMLKNMPEVVK